MVPSHFADKETEGPETLSDLLHVTQRPRGVVGARGRAAGRYGVRGRSRSREGRAHTLDRRPIVTVVSFRSLGDLGWRLSSNRFS